VAVKNLLVLPQAILKRPPINPEHQKDMKRRDHLIEQEDKKPIKHYSPPRTYAQDHRDAIIKIKHALVDKGPTPPVKTFESPPLMNVSQSTTRQINIAMIRSTGFTRYLKSIINKIFIISIYQINKIIVEKHSEEEKLEFKKI
jgi:hypothetical protein